MQAGLSSLAAGDLTVRLNDDLGEFDDIRVQFNNAVERLDSVMAGVLRQALEVTQEVASISSGMNDLSIVRNDRLPRWKKVLPHWRN